MRHLQNKRGKEMTNGHKHSDPVIDYLDVTIYSYEDIDEWLTENYQDEYLIKWYYRYLTEIKLELLFKLDDQSASIVCRAWKLLDKLEATHKVLLLPFLSNKKS
jgi:hypothetical protein